MSTDKKYRIISMLAITIIKLLKTLPAAADLGWLRFAAVLAASAVAVG